MLKKVFEQTAKINVAGKLFAWCGEHSLEIYLAHYLILTPLKLKQLPCIGSVQGVCITAANYLITVTAVLLTVKLLNTNKVLKFILFGNKK